MKDKTELRSIGFGRESEEAEEQDEERLEHLHPAILSAAEDLMDAMGHGGGYIASPSEGDSKMEKATKEATKRARAEVFAEAFMAMFEACELAPHEEGEHEER